MATESDISQVSENFGNFTIEQENNKKHDENHVLGETLEYGLPLTEVYKLAFNFYRGKYRVSIIY